MTLRGYVDAADTLDGVLERVQIAEDSWLASVDARDARDGSPYRQALAELAARRFLTTLDEALRAARRAPKDVGRRYGGAATLRTARAKVRELALWAKPVDGESDAVRRRHESKGAALLATVQIEGLRR